MEGCRVFFPDRLKVEIARFDVGKPGNGKVLIETEATLISTGTELTGLTGDFPENSSWSRYIRYPFVAGYSAVGRVIEAGTGVEKLKVGDRVAAGSPHATHAIVDAEQAVKVPEDIGLEDACFHTLAAGVMNSVRLAKVSFGSSVVAVGQGLLGQLVVLFSRFAGAFPVVAVDLAEERLRLSKLSGATATLQANNWDAVQGAVERLTKGRFADKVFEVTGNPAVIPLAIGLVKSQGYFVLLSSPRGKTSLDFHDEVNRPSRIIIGTHFGSQPTYESPYNPWTRIRNTELFFDLLSAGLFKIGHLVTHRYPWRRADEAYKMLLEDRTKAIGVILQFKS